MAVNETNYFKESYQECKSVRRELCFFSEPSDGSAPRYETDNAALKGTRNYEHTRSHVDMQDVRGHEDEFDVSVHGFGFHQRMNTKHIDFGSSTDVSTNYFPLVKEAIAAHISHLIDVIPYNVTIRCADAKGRNERPVRKVHVDQSARGAYLRAEYELAHQPHLLENIIKSRVRYRIINVWKSISGTVRDHPIAFANSRTVQDRDLVPVEQVYPHYTGETLAVRHNENQRYWYWSEMGEGDALLLQIYDSGGELGDEGRLHSARCAHSSFSLSGRADEPMNRESVEVRCFVITSS